MNLSGSSGRIQQGPVSRSPHPIEVQGAKLQGDLSAPAQSRGLVIFAHGSGSSRLSPRNQFVARQMNNAGLATLLFDLLTPQEETDRANVFDIGLLGRRLVEVTRWAKTLPELDGLPTGYFGASTGAAAALIAAAEMEQEVRATVSRGGRPDLARERLPEVLVPTLLIVGGHDAVVLELNREAQDSMTRSDVSLEIVPGATHLFEEPGALEKVAELAIAWFNRHFNQGPAPS